MTDFGEDLSAENVDPLDETSEGAETVSAPSGSSGEVPLEESQDVDFTEFEEDLGPGSLLVQAQAELEKAKDDLARSRAETYNVRQDYNNYVKRARAEAGERRSEGQLDAVEALLPVLDDILAARAAGDLDGGPFASIATKLEETLGNRFALQAFGDPGEPFDPERHDALMLQPNPDPSVEGQVVGQVLQPGYLAGERVLRPAKVLVFDPA